MDRVLYWPRLMPGLVFTGSVFRSGDGDLHGDLHGDGYGDGYLGDRNGDQRGNGGAPT